MAPIACRYCGGTHDLAQEVRACWSRSIGAPPPSKPTAHGQEAADTPDLPQRGDPEPDWKGQEQKMPQYSRHPSQGAAAVQRRHPTPPPTGDREPLRDKTGHTTPPVTPPRGHKRTIRPDDYRD